jgi:hypothetical protein
MLWVQAMTSLPGFALLLIASLSVTGSQLSNSSAEEAAQTFSVCELLMKMNEMDGKLISVRGVMESSEHALFLSDPSCPKPLRLRGQEYPALLYLTAPGSPYVRKKTSFTFDYRSHADALSRQKGRQKWVLVTGRIDAFPFGEYNRNGSQIALGFGPENGFPCQIVMKDVVTSERN